MLLDFINGLGPILAGIMLLALVASIVLCVRASRRAASRPAARSAMFGAFLPFAVAFIVGPWLVVLLVGGQNMQWHYVVKNCLVGLTLTAVPLIWSIVMLRSRRASA